MESTYRIGKNEKSKVLDLVIRSFNKEIENFTTRFGIKRKVAESMFSIPLVIGLSKGEVYLNSTQMEGLMVVFPGKSSNFGLFALLSSVGFFSSFAVIKLMMRKELLTVFTQLSHDKKSLNLGSYYYLAVLGVSPEHQGKGIGGKLLADLCKRADAEGKAIYLETQNEKNVAWYEGYGFKVLKKLGSENSIELWEMARVKSKV